MSEADDTDESTPYTREVKHIVDACRPHLAGHTPQAQGAAIAELLAWWISGHHTLDGSDIAPIRVELMAHVTDLVKGFLEIFDEARKEHVAKHAH